MASAIRVRILGDASGFRKAVRDADDAVGSLEGSFGGLATRIGGAFAALSAGSVVKGAIDAAADIGEQYSKLSVLVGDSAKELDEWSKTTAKSIGVGRQEALQGLGTFANLFQVMGKGEKETAAMSKRFVELATDMASFNNANPAEVIEALGAALRGESEPIRKFGVMLDDATLKSRALAMGLEWVGDSMPPNIKMQAAYAEVLAQTSKQQGDVARTADSLSNQTRFLSAEFKDLQIELGQQLLPIAAEVVRAIRNGLVPAMQNAMPIIGGLATAAFDAGRAVAGIVGPFAEGGAQALIFAAGASAAYKALEQIVARGKGAIDAVSGLGTALSTPLGVAGLGATLIGGALAYAFVEHQKEAAESKKKQEALTAALREANDPVQILGDRFAELAKELDKLKPKQDDAKEAIEGVGEQFLFTQLQARGAATDFNRLGLSLEEVTRQLQGSEADYQQFIRNLQKSAAEQGVFGKRSLELVGAIRDTREAFIASREEIAKNMRAGLEAAVVAGKLTQAQLDTALSTSKAGTELMKWYEVGQMYADLLPKATDKTDELTEATDKNADATDKAVLSDKDLAEAKKKLTEAIDKQIEATLAAASADLAHQRQQRSLAEASQALTQKQADLNAAVRDYGPNSQQAQTAAYELEESLASLKGEALQTAESAVNLARKQAEAAGQTLSARDANLLMISELGNLRNATADPQLQAYLDALILKFRGAEDAAFRAAMGMAELSRQAALAAGATQIPGVGIVTPADRLDGARASGGPVGAGKSYLVGERGPEVLTMGRQSGFVTPNSGIAQAAGGIVIQSLTVNGVVASSMDQLAREIREAIRRVERAQR